MLGNHDVIGIFGLVFIAIGALNWWLSRKYGYRDREDRWGSYAELAAVVILSIAGAVSLIRLSARSPAQFGYLSPVGFVALGVMAAFSLFFLRRWRKDFYGAVEMIIALVTLVWVSRSLDPSQAVATTLAFVGAVYVLVRGMSNFVEGWSERRVQRLDRTE